MTLTVNAVNSAPVARDDAFATDEDTPVVFEVRSNDSDVETGVLTPSIVRGPQNGRLAIRDDGSFGYTPNADFNGADSFTYEVSDGALRSNLATVTLSVRPVNDAPTIAAVAPQNVDEGQRFTLDLVGGDVDAGDVLRFTLDSGPAGATITAGGRLEWAAVDGPSTDSFVVRVTDAAGASSSRTFAVQTANVAPAILSQGAPNVEIGARHELSLSYADVGADAVTTWFIDWGDGSSSVVDGRFSSASHVYGAAADNHIIRVQAQDDDGLWNALPRSVRVLAAAPQPPAPVPPAPAAACTGAPGAAAASAGTACARATSAGAPGTAATSAGTACARATGTGAPGTAAASTAAAPSHRRRCPGTAATSAGTACARTTCTGSASTATASARAPDARAAGTGSPGAAATCAHAPCAGAAAEATGTAAVGRGGSRQLQPVRGR